MPSNAYNDHFQVMMQDAEELLNAHRDLRTGQPGRQWGIGALNRSSLVMALSAWEHYVESLANEVVEIQMPTPPPLLPSLWHSLKTTVAAAASRMNSPTPYNVRTLLCDACGLADVTAAWSWSYSPDAKANTLALDELVKLRGQIAHGVNPRPTVHNTKAGIHVKFVRKLARATDDAVRDHLRSTMALNISW